MQCGKTTWDIGRTISWADFRDFVTWLPPTGESALWRARKPNSWWVTPETHMLNNTLYTLQVANRQRARRGAWPKPMKLPEDREVSVKSADELGDRRRRQAQHLRNRRKQKREVKRG